MEDGQWPQEKPEGQQDTWTDGGGRGGAAGAKRHHYSWTDCRRLTENVRAHEDTVVTACICGRMRALAAAVERCQREREETMREREGGRTARSGCIPTRSKSSRAPSAQPKFSNGSVRCCLFLFAAAVVLRNDDSKRGEGEGNACTHAKVQSADVHVYVFSAFRPSRPLSNRVLCILGTTRPPDDPMRCGFACAHEQCRQGMQERARR